MRCSTIIHCVIGSRRDWWLVAAWLAALALVRAGTVEERDPYWQARAGLETVRGQPLVRPDAWSWDPVDAPFVQTSPGWNAVLGIGWDAAGFVGIFLVALLSVGLYLLVATALAARLGARPLPALAGILLCVLPALAMVSPRATLVAQTLFLAGLLGVHAVRGPLARRRPPGAGLAVGVAAFATTAAGLWLHLSWLLFAPVTAVCWGLLWFTTPGLPRTRAAVLSAAGAAGAGLGLLAGPYGTAALAYSERVRAASTGLVIEWLGVLTPGLAGRWLPAALLAVGVSGAGAWWAAARLRSGVPDERVGPVAALCVLALPAALASVSAIRLVGVALLTLAPVAALGASAAWDRVRRRAGQSPPRGVFRSARVRFWSDGRPWRTVLTVVLVVLSPGVVLLTAPLARPLPELAVLDALPRGCRLVSDPSSAGPVLLLRPDVTVWFDGRFDYWGRGRMVEATKVLSAEPVPGSPLREATCVMLSTTDPLAGGALADTLDASPQWRSATPSGGVRVWTRTG